MLFAVPVVGRVLAGCSAAEASANASATQKINQVKLQASSGGQVDPNAFAQALNGASQSAPSQPSLLSTALSIATGL